MKHLVRKHAIVLAALLQVLPIVRNVITNPAATSTFAIILRWTIGSTAALGAFDAYSAPTAPNFTCPTNFVGTVGTFFTNNITLSATGTDGNALAVITTNSVSIALSVNGQTTNFAMPPGLNIRYIDNRSLANAVYDSIFGIPTNPSTNTFNITMSYAGSVFTSTNITIRILAATGAPPVITNQPVSVTNVAGGSASFSVVAGGVPAVSYQWKFNTNAALPGATNASFTITNTRAGQAGAYTVVITNAAGAITSAPAALVVTAPVPPPITAPAVVGGQFQFSFNPVAGLTNTVLTNTVLNGGAWIPLTNIPPPPNTNPVTVTDSLSASNRFYRVQVIP
jgi:hypothetical protein